MSDENVRVPERRVGAVGQQATAGRLEPRTSVTVGP
jgi:hypothetical protein